MKEIKAYVRNIMVDDVVDTIEAVDDPPTVKVMPVHRYSWRDDDGTLQRAHEITKIEMVAPDAQARRLVDIILEKAHTGNSGDGRIIVNTVDEVWSIQRHHCIDD
mgnify:CR=1 FL=1